MAYDPDELDILSRAFHGAIESIAMDGRDTEATKAAVMNGMLDAARAGERDEERLKASALASVALYDEGSIDAVIRAAPL